MNGWPSFVEYKLKSKFFRIWCSNKSRKTYERKITEVIIMWRDIYVITLQDLNICHSTNCTEQPELFQKSKLNHAILLVKMKQWLQSTLKLRFRHCKLLTLSFNLISYNFLHGSLCFNHIWILEVILHDHDLLFFLHFVCSVQQQIPCMPPAPYSI